MMMPDALPLVPLTRFPGFVGSSLSAWRCPVGPRRRIDQCPRADLRCEDHRACGVLNRWPADPQRLHGILVLPLLAWLMARSN
jgi:hypothetical protein